MAATEATVDPTEPTEPTEPAEGSRGLAPLLLAISVVAVTVQLYGLYQPGGPPIAARFPHADKVEHLIGFAAPVGAILLWRHAAAVGRFTRGTGIVLLVFAVHAGVSELIQDRFYTYRSGDPYDLLANLVGVAVGWLTYRLLRRGTTRP